MVPHPLTFGILGGAVECVRGYPVLRRAWVAVLLIFLTSSYQAAATPAISMAGVHGRQPILVVLCRFPDVPAEPRSAAYFRDLFGNTYPGLDNYWREVSYGAVSLEGTRVLDWQTLPLSLQHYRSDSAPEPDPDRLANDCISTIPASVRLDLYRGLSLMFNADIGDPRTGRVCLERDESKECHTVMWIGPNGFTSQATVAHELGHAFGLKHSSVGDDKQYGNPWDVMSLEGPCGLDPDFGRIAQHPIAYHKELLGWIAADRKFLARPGTQATVRLGRLSLPPGDGYLLAEIPIGGSQTHFYTVEARRQVGFDVDLPGEGVVIHEINTLQNPPAHPVDSGQGQDGATATGMWPAGSLFSDPDHGIAVSVDQEVADGFVVTIFTRPLPWPVSPARQSLVAAQDAGFAWQPVPGAAAYELQFSLPGVAAKTPVASKQVAGTKTVVTLAPGRYSWRVRALPDGAWTPDSDVTLTAGPGAWRPVDGPINKEELLGSEPSVAVDAEGNQHVVWVASQPATGRTRVLYNAHLRDGAWTTPQRVNDSEATRLVQSLAVAVDAAGNVYTAWADDRHPAGQDSGGIYFSYRAALGLWHGNERIDDDPDLSARGAWAAMAVDGRGNAYAIWTDARNGKPDVYFAYRPVRGGWGPNIRVNEAAGLPVPDSARIAVDLAGNAYAVWTDARSGRSNIYFAYRAAEGGWGQNVKVNDDAPGSRGSPAIAVDGNGNAYALWQDFRACSRGKIAMGDVYFAMRASNGAWGGSEQVTTSGLVGEGTRLSLAVDTAGNVYAVWQERLRGMYILHSAYRPHPTPEPGSRGIRSSDWATIAVADSGGSSEVPVTMSVAADLNGNAYLAWAVTTHGERRVLFADAVKPTQGP